MITVVRQCQKEIGEFPKEVRGELADAFARLEEGHKLSMPLSRPMPSIGNRVHELRVRDRSGIYRVIYWIAREGRVFVLHGFMKKTSKTSKENIELSKRRMKEIFL